MFYGTPFQTLHYTLSNILYQGKPKDQMFLNTSVASQMVFLRRRSHFGYFGAALKIIYWLGSELWPSRKFKVAFSSHPKLLATLMGPVES